MNIKDKNFFNEYPSFAPGATKDRLNKRYEAIINNNKKCFPNSKVLDIASHDGRWSFAATKNGAKHVLGIEGRSNLVDLSNKNFVEYDVSPDLYTFKVGDIHQELRNFNKNQFDVILCLGFFYHTAHHFLLLEEFERLAPKYLILDTAINWYLKGNVISWRKEPSEDKSMAIGNKKNEWVGWFTKSLLSETLNDYGFDIEYFDWPKFLNNNNSHKDYSLGRRVTVLATRKN